ncbi:TRAP transporter substrate-binding protein [Azospirillum sp. ST 5-10]|uniref:TRAP transporter substrate-binding protein n=1 Tax=unclassified Azospirillum TaxID=2630922 RepID=UPI003F4A6CE8
MMTASKAFTAAAIVGSAICMSCVVPANAADVNLRYAHFMPQGSWQHEKMFDAWAKAVAAESGGRIGVTVFPAQTLGKAPAGYDNAKTGITDIAWTVQGYTANRFPLSQIVELPGLFETGAVGSCAFQKLYDSGALDGEYKETHVLYVHTHGPGHLHTKDKAVTTLDDLKGLKIRRPTDVVGELLSQLGAEPVGMPAPATYEAMQRGAIDGYMLPWESVESFRTYEVGSQHTDFGFYSLAFVVTMNKAKYEALPADLKKVIDDNSGMKWAVVAGRGYDEGDKDGIAKIKETGGQIHTLSEAERPAWEAAAARAAKAYLDKLDAQGLPGTATYEKVKGYVADCKAEL